MTDSVYREKARKLANVFDVIGLTQDERDRRRGNNATFIETALRAAHEDGHTAGKAEGLEMAAGACEAQIEGFLSPEYTTDQPSGSFGERFACATCADAIRALKTTPPKESRKEEGWHPIETAPRNGTPIDLWCICARSGKAKRRTDCSWVRLTDWTGNEFLGWQNMNNSPFHDFQPTHWMPRPAPPPAPEESE